MTETISLDVDGTAVTCHLGGTNWEDEDPVVLLPGIGGSASEDFSFLFPMLARHHRVMAVDFSPTPSEGKPLELEHLVMQVRTAIDELLPGSRPAVVGYSLGAVVAVAVATSHPAPRRLVLASGWLKATASLLMFNSIWQQLSGQDAAALRQFAKFSALGNSFINSSPAEELQQISPFSLGPSTGAQIQLATAVDLTDVAPDIRVPTLVIGCSDDAIAGREQSEALAGAIPDARYAELESGHAVAVERPAELLSLIDRFLRRPRYPSASVDLGAGA